MNIKLNFNMSSYQIYGSFKDAHSTSMTYSIEGYSELMSLSTVYKAYCHLSQFIVIYFYTVSAFSKRVNTKQLTSILYVLTFLSRITVQGRGEHF